MAPSANAYKKRGSRVVTPVVIGICLVVIVITLFFALWNNGAFLPNWVAWKRYATEMDINGNGATEEVILTNRHLTIIDDEGDHCVTPNEWLVSDVNVGDINGDGTPELIVLFWQRDQEGATYRLPLSPTGEGFSQHLLVFDYENDEIKPIWMSSPLRFDVKEARLESNGSLSIELTNGDITHWAWQNPGFLLEDDIVPLAASI